jgi:hypothetical protein
MPGPDLTEIGTHTLSWRSATARREARFRRDAIDDRRRSMEIHVAATAAAGNTPNLNVGVTNMILQLGKVSIETKGPPFSSGQEIYNGTVRLYLAP